MPVITLPDWYYKKWAMQRVWHPALDYPLILIAKIDLPQGVSDIIMLYEVEEGTCLDLYKIWTYAEGMSTKVGLYLHWAEVGYAKIIARDEGYGKATIEIPFGLEYPYPYYVGIQIKNYAPKTLTFYMNMCATLRKAE